MKNFSSFYNWQNYQLMKRNCASVWHATLGSGLGKGRGEVAEKPHPCPLSAVVLKAQWGDGSVAAEQRELRFAASLCSWCPSHLRVRELLSQYKKWWNLEETCFLRLILFMLIYCLMLFFSLENIVTNKPKGKTEILIRGSGNPWLWEWNVL